MRPRRRSYRHLLPWVVCFVHAAGILGGELRCTCSYFMTSERTAPHAAVAHIGLTFTAIPSLPPTASQIVAIGAWHAHQLDIGLHCRSVPSVGRRNSAAVFLSNR